MKLKAVIGLTLIFLSGCATSAKAVKEHNLLNIFYSNSDFIQTAGVISDMTKFCSSGIFIVEHEELPTIGKSVISLKNKNAQHYYLYVEVESKGDNESKVSVYHYMNTEVTRTMAKTIESWVNNKSQTCVQGF